MIFKKSGDMSSSSSKNYGAQPKSATPQRREPELSRPYASAPSTPQLPYPPATAAPTPPVPQAQTRRPAHSPASAYARTDQLRKLTVGRDISLNGEITTCDHLVVEGTVKATIKGGKILEISESGAFEGVVDIQDADIAGAFDGNLTVRGKLTIRSTAQVTGKIYYAQLQIDTGATINGQLNTLEIKAVGTSSPEEEEEAYTEESTSSCISDDEQKRLFSFSTINDEPGFLKASA